MEVIHHHEGGHRRTSERIVPELSDGASGAYWLHRRRRYF
jgi:hypothetical protein